MFLTLFTYVLTGYCWNTMETNCRSFVKSCHDCQTHANLYHVPPSELYNMTSPWPFFVWGIDVIERRVPMASNGHEYILVAIDYFTKWVEIVSCSMLKIKHVAWFIENNIICLFGVHKKSSLTIVPIVDTTFCIPYNSGPCSPMMLEL